MTSCIDIQRDSIKLFKIVSIVTSDPRDDLFLANKCYFVQPLYDIIAGQRHMHDISLVQLEIM